MRWNGGFLFSSFSSSVFANSPIPDVLRLNASLKVNWWPLFRALNCASQSDPGNMTAHERGSAWPAIKEGLSGTRTKDGSVSRSMAALMRLNSELFQMKLIAKQQSSE
jgi:hypothetical protein